MLQEPEKKKKTNPLLMKVIIISLVLHGIAGVVAAFVTFVNYISLDTTFEEPPPAEVEEPPQEIKVEIEREQPIEQLQQKLTMPSVAEISIGNLDLSLPDMNQNFTVSAGIGRIGGSGLLSGIKGNIGIGLSTGNIFGLKTQSERFLVVIDANRKMVADSKGGLNSYQVIKDEVASLVENFSAGTLFNVVFYDQGNVLFFKPKLVAAGSGIKKELAEWIQPVNSDAATVGLSRFKETKPITIKTLPQEMVHQVLPNIQWDGNQVGYVTQLAIEQNADAIFLITGYHRGFEELRRPMNEREAVAWEREVNSSSYQSKLAKHNAEISEMRQRIKEELQEINKSRTRSGRPPRILKDPTNIYKSTEELGFDWKNRHPGDAPSFVIKPREIEDYFEQVVTECYGSQKEPSVNVILFLAGDENFSDDWEKQLNQYVRFFKGKKRIIRGADEINSARSSTPVEQSQQ